MAPRSRSGSAPPKRAGIYVRISVDRDDTEESTKRQEKDCRKFAADKGWSVAGVYRDTDTSAYKPGVKRPEYDRLLADAEAGALDVVVFWKLDRLSRSMHELLRVFKFFKEKGVDAASVTDQQLDTSTPMGTFVFHLMASLTELESATTGFRVARAERERAERGEPHGGGSRAFGYDRDGKTVREDEAALLREAAERFLNGESLRSICFDWNRREVKTTTDRDWSSTVLSATLGRVRHAGYRVHRDVRWPAEWAPIFDDATALKLAAALADSRSRVGRREFREHLLAGHVRCGVCGSAMHVFRRQQRGVEFVRWRCRRDPGCPGCGRVSISYGSLDRFVTTRFLAAMSDADVSRRALGEDQRKRKRQLERQFAKDRARLKDLARELFIRGRYAEKELSEVYAEFVQIVEEEGAALERMGGEPTTPLRIPKGITEIVKWWDGLSFDNRKVALDTFVDHVAIDPAKRRGGNRFDASRVRFVWR